MVATFGLYTLEAVAITSVAIKRIPISYDGSAESTFGAVQPMVHSKNKTPVFENVLLVSGEKTKRRGMYHVSCEPLRIF